MMKNSKLLPLLFFILLSLSYCSKKEGGKNKQDVADSSKKAQAAKIRKNFKKRADSLVSKMTLEEKVSQMMYDSKAIPRLDIPKYNWWNEALHGIGRNGHATIFPQAIGMAATFDKKLVHEIATAISDEARAKYYACEKKDRRGRYQGLTFWSPNVNIFRDPRWGRGHETYGEDPYLSGKLGVQFVKGMQGNHPDVLKTGACAKHYVVHSGPEGARHRFNAKASLKDMHETYLPAFKDLVDADVEAIMCAYNRTNGEACCGSKTLLQDLLRNKWNFNGHILSDCWALQDFHKKHNVTENAVKSAALAVNSGVNLNCGDLYVPNLEKAVKQGYVKEDSVNKRLSKLMETRFELGLFDKKSANPYSDIDSSVINCDKHKKLSKEAATKSVVMLKNNGILPLSKDIGHLYVVGPNATSMKVLMGNYYGVNDDMVTILEGLVGNVNAATKVQYKKGVRLASKNVNPIDWVTPKAKDADATIAVMGLSPLLEGEEGESIASPYKGDRKDIKLPQHQIDFVKKLKKNSEDKPLILVLTGGSPIAIPELHDIVDAVLFVWYPGEQGGNAIADIVFGDKNPSGKLPLTFPKSVDQLPAYENYSMEGRTYRYMKKEPLYPFGFGLSYTDFKYTGISLDKKKIEKGKSVNVTVNVKNTGKMKGEEVVQLYLSDVKSSVRTPRYSLKGFQRVQLKPGQSKKVTFKISPEKMKLVNEKGEHVLESGDFKVIVGGSSPGERSIELGAAKHTKATFTLM